MSIIMVQGELIHVQDGNTLSLKKTEMDMEERVIVEMNIETKEKRTTHQLKVKQKKKRITNHAATLVGG